MKSSMKIIMLAKDSMSSKIMYNAINDEFGVQQVIFESNISKLTFLKRRIKRIGLIKTLGQVVFQFILSPFLQKTSRNRVNQIISDNDLDVSDIPYNKVFKVNSINEEKSIERIKNLKPDVIIVNGTRIISSKVLKSTKAIIVNAHAGITPKYRGVHGGYWALVNKDAENCGVTVHLIDEGVDTGGILYQEKITITVKDNFTTYPLLQLNKGIHLMKKTLLNLKEGKLIHKVNTSESKLWYHPTAWEYLYYRLILKVK